MTQTPVKFRQLLARSRDTPLRIGLVEAPFEGGEAVGIVANGAGGSTFEALREVVEALGGLGDAQPWILHLFFQGGYPESRPREPRRRCPSKACKTLAEHLRLGGTVGHDELRRLGRRRRPRIGDKIDKGEVDLMADRRHDRDRRRGDRANERLVVEGSKVIAGAATATEDDHVDGIYPPEGRERSHKRFAGASPLDNGRREEEVGPATPKRDVSYVVNDGPRTARHDADDPRLFRKGALVLRIKEPLGGELLLQRFECFKVRPSARRFDAIADKLQATTRCPEDGTPKEAKPRAIANESAPLRRDAVFVGDNVESRLRLTGRRL
jgi:hypothetical protein